MHDPNTNKTKTLHKGINLFIDLLKNNSDEIKNLQNVV